MKFSSYVDSLTYADKFNKKNQVLQRYVADSMYVCRFIGKSTMGVQEAETGQSYLERLKEKWGLKSLLQVILILIVFSLTGLTVVIIRPVIFTWIGFDEQTSWWLKTTTYVLLIFPMYQILILVYGILFGQFDFFWEKEKKLLKILSKPFRSNAKGS